MLGVLPGELMSLAELPELAEAVCGKLIVSLLAGLSRKQVNEAFGHLYPSGRHGLSHVSVGPVIPTIAAQVKDSVTLISEPDRYYPMGQGHQQLCNALFERIDSVQYISENSMNEATATSAVCYAIAMCAVDAAVDASVAKGLPRAAALNLAANSLRSAAGLLGGEMTPEELKAAVSVPGGITINSVLKLDRANMRFAVADAVGEAIDYTRSMAKP